VIRMVLVTGPLLGVRPLGHCDMSGPVLPGPGQPHSARLAHSLAPPCWHQPGGGAVGVALGTAVGVAGALAEVDGLAEAVTGGWLPADFTAGAGLEQAASSAPAATMTATRTAADGRAARRPDAIKWPPSHQPRQIAARLPGGHFNGHNRDMSG
jgi:hypothetical protein